jgi:hypothetical protein
MLIFMVNAEIDTSPQTGSQAEEQRKDDWQSPSSSVNPLGHRSHRRRRDVSRIRDPKSLPIGEPAITGCRHSTKA